MVNALLMSVLERSRSLGFLGPGPLDVQVDHALAFVQPLGEARSVLDLGSGGGLPGLVLALELPQARFLLLDGMQRRCAFLVEAAQELGVEDRVDVLCERAEEAGRRPELRGQFDAVVSRSFGPPAVAAECAVGFLSGPGAQLLVSEPPTGSDLRWPADGLAQLELVSSGRHSVNGATIQLLSMTGPCPERYPRRTGIPSKRPLF